jgi:HEAT repeat protein
MDGLVPLAHRLSERKGESDLADTRPFRKTHVSVSNGYRLMRTALGLYAFLLVGLAAAGNATAQAGPSAAVPDWFVRGVVAALEDPAPGVSDAALKLPRAAQAVFAAARAGPEPVRKALLNSVRASLNSQDPFVRRAAAATLEVIAVLEPDSSITVAGLRERLEKDHEKDQGANVRNAAAGSTAQLWSCRTRHRSR